MGAGGAPTAEPSGSSLPARGTRSTGVRAASLPAEAAVVWIQVSVCVDIDSNRQLTGFALADDVGLVSLAPPPPGCRAALAGEATVRAETITADGFTGVVSTTRSDVTGAIVITVPGAADETIRLTMMDSTSDASITMTLSPGQFRALTLVVPAADGAGDQALTGPNTIDWSGGAADGPLVDRGQVGSPGGWSALAGLLLATLALVAAGFRRTTFRR